MKTKIYSCYTFLALTILYTSLNAQTSANTSLSNLTSPTKVNITLQPDKDNKRDLGSLNKAWRNLCLDSAIYIDSVRFIAFKTGSGGYNTAIGKNVLHLDQSGESNTAVGYASLYHNTNGSDNTTLGRGTLFNNTNGIGNVAIGMQALNSNDSGSENTALGSYALYSNTIGDRNTAIGEETLKLNAGGIWNTAIGAFALESNTSGDFNTAIGYGALMTNTGANFNTATGHEALFSNTTGYYNTANGTSALGGNSTGGWNVAEGIDAGLNVVDGNSNTFVGSESDCGSLGHITNGMALGYQATVTSNNHVVIGNGSVTSIGGYANWTTFPSDGRVKKNIKQNVPGLSFINKLQPITYNLDLNAIDKIIDRPAIKDKAGKTIQPSQTELDARKAKEQIVYTGFIAQDVEKAAQSLNYDFSGVDKPDNANTLYGLRYGDFVVPLVKAVQELSRQNDSLNLKISEFENLKMENQQLEQRVAKLEAMMNVSRQSAVNSQQSIAISSASLAQNVPNPFSNSTTINYSLSQQFSSAKIIITDKNGNAIKQINLSGNKGSVNVDASTLSSGAYQYSLIVDGKSIATKQMILAK
jgi:hypothetical protein